MNLWVLTSRPRDHPDVEVLARRWQAEWGGLVPSTDVESYPSLAAARAAMLGRGLAPIPRAPEDDSVIIETWV